MSFDEALDYISRWKSSYEYERKVIYDYVEYDEVFGESTKIVNEILERLESKKAKRF